MTGYEVAARQAKAEKMAKVLADHGADSATAAELPVRGRWIVAQLAGCHKASDATWEVVVDVLRGWEAFNVRSVA